MKLVLDVYKGAAKDLRDKVEVRVQYVQLYMSLWEAFWKLI